MPDKQTDSQAASEPQVRSSALLEAQARYIKLLEAELNEVVGMAYAHGWRSDKYEQGVALRAEIESLSASNAPAHRAPDQTL
jgi:hypothetical protein